MKSYITLLLVFAGFFSSAQDAVFSISSTSILPSRVVLAERNTNLTRVNNGSMRPDLWPIQVRIRLTKLQCKLFAQEAGLAWRCS
jgi:hypothetical protein